jgi:hypothetical protein
MARSFTGHCLNLGDIPERLLVAARYDRFFVTGHRSLGLVRLRLLRFLGASPLPFGHRFSLMPTAVENVPANSSPAPVPADCQRPTAARRARKMAEHGDGKLIPPPEVIERELETKLEARLRADITVRIFARSRS